MGQTPILVTGAAGFIGARVVARCNLKKIPVISVDDPAFFNTRPELAGIDFGRIVDKQRLDAWLIETRPQLSAIIHMGACSDTTEWNEDVLKKWNVDSSKSLWQYATTHQIPLIYASSAATYGAGEQGYQDQENAMQDLLPLNPYGRSKLTFDLWAWQEHQRGHRPPAWAGFKFFNVYGFGERHKGRMASVVLQAFDQIQQTGAMRLFESHQEGIPHGHQKRDFIYVEDAVDVMFFALQKKIPPGIYNLGTGQARTFLDLVQSTFRALKKPEQIVFIPTPMDIRDKYQYFTQADVSKLREAGYHTPFTSLEEGVTATVDRLMENRPQPSGENEP